ncbi:MAG: GldG family protein [Gallionella sp.]|nr:GldG family protein [Gallionella sp.]
MLKKILNNQALRNTLFVLLLVAVAGGLSYLASRHSLQRDMTFAASNSLTEPSIALLAELKEPLSITVYATEQDARLGDIRKIIREFVSLYQRYKPDIKLTFIDPEKESKLARDADIQLNGEMVVEYAGRTEHITLINEQQLSSTLLRMAHSKSETLMYLSGHGERKLDGIANFDMGNPFGAKLKQNGYRIAPLNLAMAQEVPNNVSTLIITQPQVDMLPGEVDKLLQYVDRGGNLLWLIDVEPLHGLERLAEKLDLILPPGVVLDPTANEMRAPANWAIGTSYTPHAITRNFTLITAFPSARPLTWGENSEWKRQNLIEVAARGWVSRSGKPQFDKAHDTRGPVIIATALQRNIQDREQRIVVVGNGAFLANSYAGNGGNVDMGMNMLNWLAGEDKLITLQPRNARDATVTMSKTMLGFIGLAFLFVAPLLLAAWGTWLWWKRRRN